MPLPVQPEVAETSVASSAASDSSTRSISSTQATIATSISTTWTTKASVTVSQSKAPAPPPPASVVGSSVVAPSPVDTSVESTTTQLMTFSPKPVAPQPSSSVSPSFWISVSPSAALSSSLSPPRSRSRSSASFTTLTTSLSVGGVPAPIASAPASSSAPKSSPSREAFPGGGIISSSPNETSNTPPPKLKKSDGKTIGGVIGGLTAVVVCGLLIFLFWKWRIRRRERANKRLSFGPYGNGIDASTGSVLVSSVACKPTDAISPVEQPYEKSDYVPPPRSRYFQPTVDTGRMLLRPIESIEELSERGSQDLEKTGKKVAFLDEGAQANPFDDSNAIEKLEPTLPTVGLAEPKPPYPAPARSGSRSHYRSRSFGSIREQQPPKTWDNSGPAPPAIAMGWMPNRPQGPPQNRYPPVRRYPSNAAADPWNPAQRTRRSASVSGANPTYPRNPVVDPPSWRLAGPPPPLRRPSFAMREAQFPLSPPGVATSALGRKASTTSLRERPSPTHWTGPDISHPLHLTRSNTKELRLGPAERSPDKAFGNSWETGMEHIHIGRSSSKHGDAARNF